MAPVKLVELGPTQYPNCPPESDPPERPLCSELFKYLIKEVTTVDNGYSHNNIKFTNCNIKIPINANSVLFATTKLNTFGRSCAFGLISASLSEM